MTTRDRRQARVDRLREWSEKHAENAEAADARARDLADRIPLGQPILADHHSAKRARRDQDRIQGGMERAWVEQQKADDQARRAANIERHLYRAIYDDDPDAVERLEAKIAALEADRERIKAYNRTARAGKPDGSLLTLDELTSLAMARRYGQSKSGQMPSYVLSNLSGRITRDRARLARLRGDT